MEVGENNNIYPLFEQQIDKWRKQSLKDDYGDIIFKGPKEDLQKLASVMVRVVDSNKAEGLIKKILLRPGGHMRVQGKGGYIYTFQFYPQNAESPNDLEYKLRIVGYTPDTLSYNDNDRRRGKFFREVLGPTLTALRPIR